MISRVVRARAQMLGDHVCVFSFSFSFSFSPSLFLSLPLSVLLRSRHHLPPAWFTRGLRPPWLRASHRIFGSVTCGARWSSQCHSGHGLAMRVVDQLMGKAAYMEMVDALGSHEQGIISRCDAAMMMLAREIDQLASDVVVYGMVSPLCCLARPADCGMPWLCRSSRRLGAWRGRRA